MPAVRSPSAPLLSPAQLAGWQRDGYLVLPAFAAAAALTALSDRARVIVDAFDPAVDAPAVFSSRDRARLAERALVASAAGVHCFFEEEAFDAQGRLVVDKAAAINKIGHALHDRDPVFAAFSRDARLAAIAAELGFVRPLLMQSMLIFKQPRIGGEVVWHQDASFLIVEPGAAPGGGASAAHRACDGSDAADRQPSCGVVGLWWALEDATRDNGCLWVAPGGHRGPLRERFVQRGESFVTERLDPLPWPAGEATTPLEVAAGTLVILHGRLPHASAPNRSDRSRLAYTLHVVEGTTAWSPLNWLQRPPDDPARGFA